MKIAPFALLFGITFGATRSDGAEAFCSMDPFASLAYDSTYFVGVATDELMPGGSPLRIKWFMDPDSVDLSPASGRVVNTIRIAKNAPRVLRDGLARSNNRVLMVPWSYGPDCRPGTWQNSGMWVAPGTHGLFSGRLRPRDKWVNDIPTFDVFASLDVPYPSAVANSFFLRGGTPLTADEVMSFYESLPRLTTGRKPRPEQLKEEAAHFEAMVEWAEKNPELAGRPPVAMNLRIARQRLGVTPWLSRESPVAGTWRFTISIPGFASETIYGRNQLLPSSLIASADRSVQLSDLDGAAPYGYSLLTVLTKNVSDLDIARWPPPTRQAYLTSSFEPALVGADSTVWTAGIELFGGRDALPDGSPMKERFDYFRNALRGVGPAGRLVLLRDGTMKFEKTFGDRDSVYAVIRGERISTQVWKPYN